MVREVKSSWFVATLTGIVVLFGSCDRGAERSGPIDASIGGSDADLRRQLGFGPSPAMWMANVDSVGRKMSSLVEGSASEEEKIAAIAAWMNSPRGIVPVDAPDDTDLVPSLAWQRRRGGCTALAWIWIRLGKALDLELRPVLLPGHVTLRTKGGRFVETLRGGLERTSTFYDSAFQLAKRPAYRLETSDSDVLEASLIVHRGLLLWKRQDMMESENCFRKASELVPGMPEAEGNLGLVLEARGDLPGAREHLAFALAGDSLNEKAKSRWEALVVDGDGS
jgi:regulator of sirC expression with transglutaminase-like and TPR domain